MEFMQNLHTIFAAAVLVLADIAVIAKAVDAIVKRANAAKNATAEEKAAAKEAVKANLKQIIFALVTDAEKELGGGTGKLKSAKVAAWVYDKIPDELKPLFSEDDIQGMIDTVLKEAQEYWNKNSKAREYIESGATVLTAEIDAISPAAGVDVDELAKAIAKAAELPQNSAQNTDV